MVFLLPTLKPEIVWTCYGIHGPVRKFVILISCVSFTRWFYLSDLGQDALVGLATCLNETHFRAEPHFRGVFFPP